MALIAQPHETLILAQADVAALAGPRDYIEAVESAFLALGAGSMQSLPVGHVAANAGAFHIKAALSQLQQSLVAIKINANFPRNPRLNGLPTIQGCIVLSDGDDGRLLAVIDSGEITARRTAAASALAARHLARRDSSVVAMIGCGTQARHHLDALLALNAFCLRALRCFDPDLAQAQRLAAWATARGLETQLVASAGDACANADIVVTCTPSTTPIVFRADIRAGTFIAAVGADSSGKCEIDPQLMAAAQVVPDILAQAVSMGDLRTAIAAESMCAQDVHAELAQVVCGQRLGRSREDEIFVFDSTGTAIEDLAAADMVYARAQARPDLLRVVFNSGI